MSWIKKTIEVGFGFLIIIAGLSILFQNLGAIISPFIFFVAGALLLGQITLKSINGEVDDKDFINWFSAIFGIIIIAVGIIMLMGIGLPMWLRNLSPWLIGIVGLAIVIQGFRD